MAKRCEKFLVVDDDHFIRTILMKLFSLYKLEAVFAADGEQALKKWEKEDFRAILMDIDMPVMDGLSATRVIRRREKEEGRGYTPIIGVSGAEYAQSSAQTAEAGMDAFVAKPFTAEQLLASISPYI